MTIERYNIEHKVEWNNFVKESKNGTFLFDRSYMDYHSDRFADNSLLFRDDKQHLLAIMPANKNGTTLFSHQGLTYGGLLLSEKIQAEQVVELFDILNAYLIRQGFCHVVYKPVPHIFHRLPAEEDLYAIFKVCHAQLTIRNISCSIDLCNPLSWNRDRRYAANKAEKEGVYIQESEDFDVFWQILTDNLRLRYDSQPVHTASEIKQLHHSFPENIKLYMAYDKTGVPLAGTVLYIDNQFVHTQYISASPTGKQLHAVDALFRSLLSDTYTYNREKKWFDFGTSNEAGGQILNEGLIHQKQGFGGRAVCYDTYEWDVK